MATQRKFCHHYNVRRSPSSKTVKNIVAKFETKGYVLNQTGLKNVWFTDEAHFYLNGIVNSQHCRIWGKEAPNEVNERPLHSDKCTAWCALSANGILLAHYGFKSKARVQQLIRNDIEV